MSTSEGGILRGEMVSLRPAAMADAARLTEILNDPGVAAWWGRHDLDRVQDEVIDPGDGTVAFAIEVDGEVIGLVQYGEENEPDYRHANIDIFLSDRSQGRGIGREAIALLARFLFDERGHHRLVIDPSASNSRAIACYEAVGFEPVGVMRQYERSPDGTFRDGLLMDLLASELAIGPGSGQELQESIEQPTR